MLIIKNKRQEIVTKNGKLLLGNFLFILSKLIRLIFNSKSVVCLWFNRIFILPIILYSAAAYPYILDQDNGSFTLTNKDIDSIFGIFSMNMAREPGYYIDIHYPAHQLLFYKPNALMWPISHLISNDYQAFKDIFYMEVGIPFKTSFGHVSGSPAIIYLTVVSPNRYGQLYQSVRGQIPVEPEPEPVRCTADIGNMNFGKVLKSTEVTASAHLLVNCTSSVKVNVLVNNNNDFVGEQGRVRVKFTAPSMTSCDYCSSQITGLLTNQGLSPGFYKWSVPITINFE